jgi:O-antigen ligase
LWSDAAWRARLYAVGPTAKLLALPFLFQHFARSQHGLWVFSAFLLSCALMVVMSWIVAFFPDLTLKAKDVASHGILVENYIDQSQEFALCAVALAYPIVMLAREKRIRAGVPALPARACLREQHGLRGRLAHGACDHPNYARRILGCCICVCGARF